MIAGVQGEARALDPSPSASPSPQDELIELLVLCFGGDIDYNSLLFILELSLSRGYSS